MIKLSVSTKFIFTNINISSANYLSFLHNYNDKAELYDYKYVNSILKYKPFNVSFFNTLEILHKFNLLSDNKDNILEISNNASYFEAIHYFERKYKKEYSNYNLLFFNKYYFGDNKEKELNSYNKNLRGGKIFNLHTKEYDGYFDMKCMEKDTKKKNNLI